MLVQFFFSGVTSGSIYALMAVSLLLVYRVSQLICFAQGEFFVLGALMMSTLMSKDVPTVVACLGALLCVAAIGSFLQYCFIRTLAMKTVGMLIVMTIALSMLLRGAALIIWGRQSYVTKPFTQGPPITVLGASIPLQVLWVVGITIAVLLCLWLFFERSMQGLAMRACAEDPEGASLIGVQVQKVNLISWMWGAAMGAVAGMVVAPLLFVQYTSGVMPMVKGFIAMSIGGLTGIFGAAAGGMFLGLVEAYTIGLVSSKFADAIVFAILIVCLLLKPSGLFSRGRRE